jgi:hypothetical protein
MDLNCRIGSDHSPISGEIRKKPSGISPLKKEIGIAKRPPGAKSDILTAADGPRAGNAANNENNMFNKHYNKELKLCEGK